MWKTVCIVIEFASGEFIVTRLKKSNGGAVIVIRSLLSSVIIFLVIILMLNLIDPMKLSAFSITEFRKNIVVDFPWFGAIFAFMYVGLYSRFSSQWSYLSNLYNQIKQVEVAPEGKKYRICEWKAAFIEDAYDLHLIYKEMFSSIIVNWIQEDDVRNCYLHYAPNGRERMPEIIDHICKSHAGLRCEKLTALAQQIKNSKNV